MSLKVQTMALECLSMGLCALQPEGESSVENRCLLLLDFLGSSTPPDTLKQILRARGCISVIEFLPRTLATVWNPHNQQRIFLKFIMSKVTLSQKGKSHTFFLIGGSLLETLDV